MTRPDIEMAFIQMGKAMKEILGAYAPNANHAEISVSGEMIRVRAYEWDDDKDDFADSDILNAVLFADGTLKINGQYIKPKGEVA